MFFERPELGRHAVLVSITLDSPLRPDGSPPVLADVDETRELAEGAGLDVRAVIGGRRRAPHPRLFVGTGKLEEIKDAMRREHCDLLLLNHDIGPGQQRNLEQALDARVMPRTELILHIFADRARSHEGQLQVQLAQLQHAQTRLVRGWTHLDRQKGGIGLRGAGETQIEMDQRMLAQRVKVTAGKLEDVARRRALGRRRRTRGNVPAVALVGYTNAGKSTLFNRLTDADVLAADRLFATLDPTLRKLALDGAGTVVLSDTVGFISQLPHSLVESFKSTLEEAVHADLLLHVVDAAALKVEHQVEEVNAVLAEIGAAEVPRVLVLNKIDLLDERASEGAQAAVASLDPGCEQVAVSAVTGQGIATLRSLIARRIGRAVHRAQVDLHAGDGQTRAWLYSQGAVLGESHTADGRLLLDIQADDVLLAALEKRPDVMLRAANGTGGSASISL